MLRLLKFLLQEEKQNNMEDRTTTLWDELIYLKDQMKEAKNFMKEKEQETQETTRDCTIMAREMFLNELAYKNDFTDFEKRIAVYLLNGDAGQEALESKFEVLNELLMMRRHIIDILGKEKGDKN